MLPDPRVRSAMRDGLRWLTPDRPTEAARAEAGAEAVDLADKLLRAALRAGLTSHPSDRLGRLIVEMEAQLRAEVEGLRADVAAPCGDQTNPALMAAE